MLNPSSPLPLYHQLAEKLSSGISAGDWGPGQRLPSEPELARQYGIGRPTVRQALEILVRRGLAERRRGSGTYVTASAGSVDLFTLAGTVSSFRSSGHELQTTLLSKPGIATSDDAPPPFSGRPAVTFRRLGSLQVTPEQSEPVAVLIEDLWLDPETFPGFEQLNLETSSVSQIVRQHYHLEPTDGEQSFHVVAPSSEVRAALQLPPNSEVLLIQRTLNFPNAKAAVFSRLYCRTDRVTFSQKLGGFQT